MLLCSPARFAASEGAGLKDAVTTGGPDLFDAGRKVCDDLEDVVGLGKVFADEGLLGTNHSDGQTGTCSTRTRARRHGFPSAGEDGKRTAWASWAEDLPGKGCRDTISSGRPSSRPRALTSSLWKSFRGSTTFPCGATRQLRTSGRAPASQRAGGGGGLPRPAVCG